jgi:hypothetical protein
MTARRGLTGFGVVVAVGMIVLLAAGTTAKYTRAFSVGVPDVAPVATVYKGQQACESPIPAPSAFGSLQIWGSAVGGNSLMAVSVTDAKSSAVLSRGQTLVMQGMSVYPVPLSAAVPAGRPVRVCLVNATGPPVYLYGSGQANSAVHLTVAGKPVPLGIALVAVRPQPQSLLSQLSTVFSRAALFRPGWVGQWTFWVLLIAVAVAMGLAGAAVAAAGAEDGRQSR